MDPNKPFDTLYDIYQVVGTVASCIVNQDPVSCKDQCVVFLITPHL